MIKGKKNCKLGNHSPRELCINYTIGFCPEGPNCKFTHVKTIINTQEDNFFYLNKIKEFDYDSEMKGNFNNLAYTNGKLIIKLIFIANQNLKNNILLETTQL